MSTAAWRGDTGASRRLFFALAPGAAARAALHALARRHAGRRARIVAANDLHLTLVFLGQVEEAALPRWQAAAAALHAAPCSVRLDNLERWRGGLLCATGQVGAPLMALHAQLVAAACGLGHAVEARPLRAHVTLARGVSPEALPAAGVPLPPLRWRSRAFCLMESRRRLDGGRYTVVGRWRLDSARNTAMQHDIRPARG